MIIVQACSGGQVYYFTFEHASTLLCQYDIKPTSMIKSMHVYYLIQYSCFKIYEFSFNQDLHFVIRSFDTSVVKYTYKLT